MSRVDDCVSTFGLTSAMVSCLALPPCSQSLSDWFVVGDASGKLYGFGFDKKSDGTFEHNEQITGRFRTNTHKEHVPIQDLIATFGVQDEHFKTINGRGRTYRRCLSEVPPSRECFYSMGRNGQVLTWRHGRQGWQSFENATRGAGAPVPVAANASRLAPHMMVLANRHGEFECFDPEVDVNSS